MVQRAKLWEFHHSVRTAEIRAVYHHWPFGEKALFTYFYFGDSYMFFNLSMTIGYLVPGILGRQMERQGIFKTLGALAVVVLIIRMVQIVPDLSNR